MESVDEILILASATALPRHLKSGHVAINLFLGK